MRASKINIIKVLLFVLLAYFPIFLHLDTLAIRIWDESRLAINAYEMYKDGNYFIPHYFGHPDMWNTKPPLMIWLQVFFMKILGVNELAIRLPSAIAAFLTCTLLILFAVKYLKDYWLGLIAVLMLITSQGYINLHSTRTGDYDSLLTFFSTAYCLLFFLYLQHHSKKLLHLFFIALTLAVFTKSVQGLLFIPALLIFTIVEKKTTALVKNKWVWIDLLLFTMVITSYYIIREAYNPGYLKAVWDNELGGRYTGTLDGHEHDFWYYYRNIVDNNFSWWYLLIPLGVLTGVFIKNEKIRTITIFSTITVITYLLIISFSKTKLSWYDIPLYPLYP